MTVIFQTKRKKEDMETVSHIVIDCYNVEIVPEHTKPPGC